MDNSCIGIIFALHQFINDVPDSIPSQARLLADDCLAYYRHIEYSNDKQFSSDKATRRHLVIDIIRNGRDSFLYRPTTSLLQGIIT